MLRMVLMAGLSAAAAGAAPGIARDAHVVLTGDALRVAVPEELRDAATAARALDERLDVLWRVAVPDGTADFGRMPVGWYRIEFLDSDGAVLGFTTAAVLEPLAVPPPADTPIAVDIALAWLGAEDQSDWPAYARLARLAGVRWVRDRLHWREMQRADGSFIPHTKYDESAAVQAAEGLQMLQVFHTRPAWALAPGAHPDRPRLDLAKLYAFCKGLAERFRGRVQAWEPWNEGNAPNFGGYTLDELCALQKAAYLGFKAGDPDVTVCWNPLGGINIASQTRSILRNETWPYFDVYSIHSYDWPHGYEDYWAHARDAASGRPLWVTECDRGMEADPGSPMGGFTPENDRRKAEFIVQSYVRSLFAGSSRHFHFILGHYMEHNNRTQFGLLRRDLTPRPGYVALAALGRLLAGATCLGRHEVPGQPNVHVYAFRARPQGQPKVVVVAWTEGEGDWPTRGQARAPWPIAEPPAIEAACDYLGRPMPAQTPRELRPDPVFLVLPEGGADALPWRQVAPGPCRTGTASSVVLQFDAPGHPPVQRTIGWSPEAAYEFQPGTAVDALLTVYNLGDAAVAGPITLEPLPPGWRAAPTRWDIALEPGAQDTQTLRITIDSNAARDGAWLEFRGGFAQAGRPVLALWNRPPTAR